MFCFPEDINYFGSTFFPPLDEDSYRKMLSVVWLGYFSPMVRLFQNTT